MGTVHNWMAGLVAEIASVNVIISESSAFFSISFNMVRAH